MVTQCRVNWNRIAAWLKSIVRFKSECPSTNV
jgi:hypothetical protein